MLDFHSCHSFAISKNIRYSLKLKLALIHSMLLDTPDWAWYPYRTRIGYRYACATYPIC